MKSITLNKKYKLYEGDFIKGLAMSADEREIYEFNSIVFLSLGLAVNQEGYHTQLFDINYVLESRKATEEEIKTSLENLEYDFVFDDGAECARKFIETNSEEEILPIKYKKFQNKEELLEAVDAAEC